MNRKLILLISLLLLANSLVQARKRRGTRHIQHGHRKSHYVVKKYVINRHGHKLILKKKYKKKHGHKLILKKKYNKKKHGKKLHKKIYKLYYKGYSRNRYYVSHRSINHQKVEMSNRVVSKESTSNSQIAEEISSELDGKNEKVMQKVHKQIVMRVQECNCHKEAYEKYMKYYKKLKVAKAKLIAMNDSEEDAEEYKKKANVAKVKSQKYLVLSRQMKLKALKVSQDDDDEKSTLIKTYTQKVEDYDLKQKSEIYKAKELQTKYKNMMKIAMKYKQLEIKYRQKQNQITKIYRDQNKWMAYYWYLSIKLLKKSELQTSLFFKYLAIYRKWLRSCNCSRKPQIIRYVRYIRRYIRRYRRVRRIRRRRVRVIKYVDGEPIVSYKWVKVVVSKKIRRRRYVTRYRKIYRKYRLRRYRYRIRRMRRMRRYRRKRVRVIKYVDDEPVVSYKWVKVLVNKKIKQRFYVTKKVKRTRRIRRYQYSSITVYKYITLPIARVMYSKKISYKLKVKVLKIYKKKYYKLFKQVSYKWIYNSNLTERQIQKKIQKIIKKRTTIINKIISVETKRAIKYATKATASLKKYKITLKKLKYLINSDADSKLIKKYKFIAKYHFKNYSHYKQKAKVRVALVRYLRIKLIKYHQKQIKIFVKFINDYEESNPQKAQILKNIIKKLKKKIRRIRRIRYIYRRRFIYRLRRRVSMAYRKRYVIKMRMLQRRWRRRARRMVLQYQDVAVTEYVYKPVIQLIQSKRIGYVMRRKMIKVCKKKFRYIMGKPVGWIKNYNDEAGKKRMIKKVKKYIKSISAKILSSIYALNEQAIHLVEQSAATFKEYAQTVKRIKKLKDTRAQSYQIAFYESNAAILIHRYNEEEQQALEKVAMIKLLSAQIEKFLSSKAQAYLKKSQEAEDNLDVNYKFYRLISQYFKEGSQKITKKLNKLLKKLVVRIKKTRAHRSN